MTNLSKYKTCLMITAAAFIFFVPAFTSAALTPRYSSYEAVSYFIEECYRLIERQDYGLGKESFNRFLKENWADPEEAYLRGYQIVMLELLVCQQSRLNQFFPQDQGIYNDNDGEKYLLTGQDNLEKFLKEIVVSKSKGADAPDIEEVMKPYIEIRGVSKLSTYKAYTDLLLGDSWGPGLVESSHLLRAIDDGKKVRVNFSDGESMTGEEARETILSSYPILDAKKSGIANLWGFFDEKLYKRLHIAFPKNQTFEERLKAVDGILPMLMEIMEEAEVHNRKALLDVAVFRNEDLNRAFRQKNLRLLVSNLRDESFIEVEESLMSRLGIE